MFLGSETGFLEVLRRHSGMIIHPTRDPRGPIIEEGSENVTTRGITLGRRFDSEFRGSIAEKLRFQRPQVFVGRVSVGSA